MRQMPGICLQKQQKDAVGSISEDEQNRRRAVTLYRVTWLCDSKMRMTHPTFDGTQGKLYNTTNHKAAE